MEVEKWQRLVIVGELNPYGADPEMALYHLPRYASGNRLREHLGLSDATYAGLKKVNLCTGRWSKKAAKDAAWDLMVEHDVVVMLGAKVKSAFEFAVVDVAFFGSLCYGGTTVVSLPHPSGLSRPWNAPDARDRARRLMVDVAPWVPWGEHG